MYGVRLTNISAHCDLDLDSEEQLEFDLTTEDGYFAYFKHVFYWFFEWQEETKQASQPKKPVVTHGNPAKTSRTRVRKQVLQRSSEEATDGDTAWREARKQWWKNQD